jgi:hypothetical protein
MAARAWSGGGEVGGNWGEGEEKKKERDGPRGGV